MAALRGVAANCQVILARTLNLPRRYNTAASGAIRNGGSLTRGGAERYAWPDNSGAEPTGPRWSARGRPEPSPSPGIRLRASRFAGQSRPTHPASARDAPSNGAMRLSDNAGRRKSVASRMLPDDPAVAAAVRSGPPQPHAGRDACGHARLRQGSARADTRGGSTPERQPLRNGLAPNAARAA
jgi:hypothetical protein